MPESVWVPKKQVINRLREDDFTLDRKTQRVEMWRKRGSTTRVDVKANKILPEKYVRSVLRQAGLSPDQIERFFREADCETR